MSELPYGILRTTMGIYVLNEDLCLSRYVERQLRLDIAENIRDISSFAQYMPVGGVAIDAGACLGDHTTTYSQLVGVSGHVYAFEPHPLTYEALTLNMARLNNVTCLQIALSDEMDQKHFQRDPNIGASFLSVTGDVEVSCNTLDAFQRTYQLHRCDFVHLDAEGWEPRILRGGREFLQKFRPVLVVEVCDKHLRRAGFSEGELMSLLDELGYGVYPIPEHIEPELRDVLCLPRTA